MGVGFGETRFAINAITPKIKIDIAAKPHITAMMKFLF